MSPPAPKGVRRRFLAALGRGLYVTWPVLSGILVIEVALGLLIGFEAVYFSFVTGLTIGYVCSPEVSWTGSYLNRLGSFVQALQTDSNGVSPFKVLRRLAKL